jgi:predicted RNA-binding Zn ribbon-like protein
MSDGLSQDKRSERIATPEEVAETINQLKHLLDSWGNNQLYFDARAVVFKAWHLLTSKTFPSSLARGQVIAECIAVCNDQRLEDPHGTEGDTAYTLAIDDCVHGIEALKSAAAPSVAGPSDEYRMLFKAHEELKQMYGAAVMRLQALGEKSISLTPAAKAMPDIERTIRDHLVRKLRSYAGARATPKDLQIALGDAANYIEQSAEAPSAKQINVEQANEKRIADGWDAKAKVAAGEMTHAEAGEWLGQQGSAKAAPTTALTNSAEKRRTSYHGNASWTLCYELWQQAEAELARSASGTTDSARWRYGVEHGFPKEWRRSYPTQARLGWRMPSQEPPQGKTFDPADYPYYDTAEQAIDAEIARPVDMNASSDG